MAIPAMKGLPYMGHLASWEVGAAAPPPLLQPPQRRPGSAAARPSPGPAKPEKMSVCCHLSITRWLNRLSSHISREIGRGHVLTPDTNAHLVCSHQLEKKKK